MTVVAAFEFDDFVPSGESAGQPHTGHSRLRPAVDHADFFDRRQTRRDELRHLDFERVGKAVAQSAPGRLAHRVDDDPRRVAENGRTPRAHVVDVCVAVDIVQVRALGPLDEKGFSADTAECADRRIHSAGNADAGRGEEFLRAGACDHDRAGGTGVLSVTTGPHRRDAGAP